LKKYINFFVRFTLTALLVLYLFKKIEIAQVLNVIVLINPLVFLFASLLYILSSYVSTLRWKIFLHDKDLKISTLFSLYLIGSFFNNVLPGIIGGDVVKILMIKEKTGIKKAVSSVFMERYIGLFALLSISLIFFILFYNKLPKHIFLWTVPVSIFGFFVGTVCLMLISKIKIFQKLRDYIFSYTKKQTLKGFFYSLIVQFIVIISVYVIFYGFNISISFFELCVFLPIIILISMLPISVSGIGVREWCFILFFGKSFGESQVVAVSLLWFLSQAFASTVGGIEYLRFKKPLNVKKK
jgi:hypothetical protein